MDKNRIARRPAAVSGVLAVLLPCAVAGAPVALAGEDGAWSGHIGVFLGAKSLDQDYWAPADDHTEFGIRADVGQANWPVALTVEYLKSSGDGDFLGATFDGETSELAIGGKWIVASADSPYLVTLAGGVTRIEAEYTGLGISDKDSVLGAWGAAGVAYAMNDRLSVGGEVRVSAGDVELFGAEGSAGGIHYGVVLEYAW